MIPMKSLGWLRTLSIQSTPIHPSNQESDRRTYCHQTIYSILLLIRITWTKELISLDAFGCIFAIDFQGNPSTITYHLYFYPIIRIYTV